MGCCQDKDRQTSDDQAREDGNEEGRARLTNGSREGEWEWEVTKKGLPQEVGLERSELGLERWLSR